MMKHFFYILTLFCLAHKAQAQDSDKNYTVSAIPQERIYLHQNTSFLMTGEYLYYQVYCFDSTTELLSDFSKIAYVELINSKHELVFRHKIRLKKGTGQGDFFFNSEIPSGTYKVLSYTLAMSNGSVADFYQKDLVVINPFQSDQSELLDSANAEVLSHQIIDKEPSIDAISSMGANLVSKKSVVQTREQINLKIKIPKELYGNYSISVRKTDNLTTSSAVKASGFKATFKNKTIPISHAGNKEFQLPELRGELIQGRIRNRNSQDPQANVKIGLSIPDLNYIFKTSTTNKNGDFFFNIDEEYSTQQALIQIIDDPNDALYYELISPAPIDYGKIRFQKYYIDPSFAEEVLNHSIGNQIQNSYASMHTDELVQYPKTRPFYFKSSRSFLLDDYTRFPTVKETILEVINDVFTRTNKDKSSIHVRLYSTYTGIDLTTLLIVDGILIQDHSPIIFSDASKIKRINIVDEFYYYGNQVYKGIVSLESFDGNLIQSNAKYASEFQDLFIPLQEKKYFQKDYNSSVNYDRIPDFRFQLYWQPNLKIEAEETSIDFYSSDIKGTYEVVVEGFSSSGKGITLKDYIEVK